MSSRQRSQTPRSVPAARTSPSVQYALPRSRRPSARRPRGGTLHDRRIRTGLGAPTRQTGTRSDGGGGKTSRRQSRRPNNQSRPSADVAAFHDAGARRVDETTGHAIPLRRDAEMGQGGGASRLCAGYLQPPSDNELRETLACGARRAPAARPLRPAQKAEIKTQP